MLILETSRLLLRRFEPGDLTELYALYRDPEVRRYFPEGTLTLDQTREELEFYLNGHPRHPELGLWAIIAKETGRFIGRCGLLPWTIDGQFEVEVAYMLAKSHWGQGLASEAALGIRDYAFHQLGLTRLICLIDHDNQASIRVAEKIGMTFEKEGRDDLGPYLLYAVFRQSNQVLNP
jgi:RimJ/RimL family protein N-acetyltransferase